MKYILVIDDDPATVGMARITLEMSEWQVVTVSDVHEVTVELRRRQPDLILMAGHINGVSGCSICQLLKNSTQFKHVPILLISKERIPADELVACGADEFLLKPFSMSEMADKTERLLSASPQLIF